MSGSLRNSTPKKGTCNWISGVKSAMGAANQLPGASQLMWMVHLHFSKKPDDDDVSKPKLQIKAFLCHGSLHY